MKCFWCGEKGTGMEFTVNGNDILFCASCVMEALLAALKLNKFGPRSFEPVAAA